ncbi:MAG: Rid family detoxifying hydrolase, partial [Actinomycetota bacterium]|nr:Rid family detoxifying hydrolase [Actinomycetota bacterium]
MTKEVVHTSAAPEAVGPYSQAIKDGGLVFCSGQVALDASSGELTGTTVSEQTRRALDNLSAVLLAAGTDLDRVVKVTAYLTDMDDFPEFNEVYGTYFANDPPARATVGVSA